IKPFTKTSTGSHTRSAIRTDIPATGIPLERPMTFKTAAYCTLLCNTASLPQFAVAADAFPSHTLAFVVPFAPGGGLDQNARAFAQRYADVLGQTVVVNNLSGAAGTIGLQNVARAKPDGYTLAFTPAVSLTSGPHRLKSVKYNLDSFDYVCQV